MQTKSEIFSLTEIAAFFSIAGMNIFQLVQGLTGAVIGIMACVYGYWRVRAMKAKALKYENQDPEN